MGDVSFLEQLDDYESGALVESDAFEEELFDRAAAGDSAELTFLDAVCNELAFLARKKQFGESHTAEEIAQLRAENPHAHYVDLGSGGVVGIPAWPSDTNRVIFHIRLDLRGYEEVEVENARPDGTPIITFRGVRCDPHDGNVYGVCFESLARLAFAHGPVIARVTGVQDGARKLVARLETHPEPA